MSAGNGKRVRCRGTRRNGEPCRSQILRDTGYCLRHDPSAEAQAIALAGSLRGGSRTRARKQRLRSKHGIDVDALGPIESPQDAERWAEAAVVAVATGRMSAAQAQALRSLLTEWRNAHEAGRLSASLKALKDALNEWKRTGDRARVLKLADTA